MFDMKTDAYFILIFMLYGIGDIVLALITEDFHFVSDFMYLFCMLAFLLIHGAIAAFVLKSFLNARIIKTILLLDVVFLGVALLLEYIVKGNVLTAASEIMITPAILQSLTLRALYNEIKDENNEI